MKGFLLTITGTATGVVIACLCTAGGLQSPRYFPTLATVLSVTGVAATFTGDWMSGRLKRRDRVYSREQLERAIGVIQERNAIHPSATSIYVAIEELKGELEK